MALFSKKKVEPEIALPVPDDGSAIADAENEGMSTSADTPVVSKLKDAHDRKLDYFQYSQDDVPQEWERENPLDVPLDIKRAYPELAFHWRAKDDKKGLTKGTQYHGWQVFKDRNHVEGVEVGGDLVLCAMPKERAESYRKYVEGLSTDQVRNMQDASMELMERAGRDLQDADFTVFQPGTTQTPGGQKVPEAGISVGARKFAGREQFRGLHPEEVAERVAKLNEDRRKNRVYSK